jgi:colanic acid/amylovoran biosynthesis glycosyltransferase
MTVAYLVNQYPKASHSFIRREVEALERLGIAVDRYALRGWDAHVPDPADRAERERTRYLLDRGVLGLIGPLVAETLTAPARTLAALRLAWRQRVGSDRRWPYHLVSLAEAARLVRWLRASKARHLHAHFGTNSAEVAMLAAALGGPPFSFTVHGPEEFDKPHALHLAEKMRRAAFTVAISSYGRSQLLRWLPQAEWHRVCIVRCGVDAGFARASTTPVPAAPRLVCVGRLCEQKAQTLLVDVAGRLRDEGLAFELVLAGDGELRAEVEAMIRERRLGDRVRITGWLSGDEVRGEIDAARALVLPSFAEGLPVVLMEALALGRPVVSTFVAGIPELVVPGENGWLVPAGDADALASALRELLGTPAATLSAMGDAGRRRTLERHDVDREARRLAERFPAAA